MAPNDFAILINTTDSFEDCWIPFFTLFKKYWPEFNGTIFLNTEKKSFSFCGLNIVSLQNDLNTSNYKPPWSECLLRALDVISDDIVLYMQEDYFLHNFVKSDLVNEFAKLISISDIGCIQLTDQATPGPFHSSEHKNLLEIDIKAPYRISTQAALWERTVLKQYLIKHETAWQFEVYGTRRARIIQNKICNVDPSIYGINKTEIIPYVFTGIIRGKWNPEIVKLFSIQNLTKDFSLRGIYNSGSQRSLIERIIHRLEIRNIIKIVYSILGIYYLKIKSFKFFAF